MSNVIFRKFPVRVLVTIYEHENNIIATKIAKTLNVTCSHLSGILKIMEDKGLLFSERVGRSNRLNLTKKGNETVRYIIELKRLIGE